jgi:hypothetical protein
MNVSNNNLKSERIDSQVALIGCTPNTLEEQLQRTKPVDYILVIRNEIQGYSFT